MDVGIGWPIGYAWVCKAQLRGFESRPDLAWWVVSPLRGKITSICLGWQVDLVSVRGLGWANVGCHHLEEKNTVPSSAGLHDLRG